jgi:hypothetical protein
MRRIICLANSYKHNERCIAGIDIESGAWVRPVSNRKDRAIAGTMRLINGKEPQLLDILEIPLENHGPDEGCQPENRLFKPGQWKIVGRIKPAKLLEYCEDDSVILHNHKDRVSPDFFGSTPKEKWKSLQLIHTPNVEFRHVFFNRRKWRSHFQDGKGNSLALKVTDPIILSRLNLDQEIGKDCILTVSLATPWRPNTITPERCYKLIAGVVEL